MCVAQIQCVNIMCYVFVVIHQLDFLLVITSTYLPSLTICPSPSFISPGIDVKIKTIELEGKQIKLQIWYVPLAVLATYMTI